MVFQVEEEEAEGVRVAEADVGAEVVGEIRGVAVLAGTGEERGVEGGGEEDARPCGAGRGGGGGGGVEELEGWGFGGGGGGV